jgi:hypothetical protein
MLRLEVYLYEQARASMLHASIQPRASEYMCECKCECKRECECDYDRLGLSISRIESFY